MKSHPNVYVNINEDGPDVSFDCPDGLCKFALCFEMPIRPDSKCCWNKNGTCVMPEARIAALEAVRRHCAQKIKRAREDAA